MTNSNRPTQETIDMMAQQGFTYNGTGFVKMVEKKIVDNRISKIRPDTIAYIGNRG